MIKKLTELEKKVLRQNLDFTSLFNLIDQLVDKVNGPAKKVEAPQYQAPVVEPVVKKVVKTVAKPSVKKQDKK